MSKEPASENNTDQGRRKLIKWLWRAPVIAVAGGAGFAFYEAYKVHFSKKKASKNPKFKTYEKQEIIPLSQISREWDSYNFVYHGIPAMVINISEELPGGVTVDGKHFSAFSRICTHQGCIVHLATNPEAIATVFNYRPKHPDIVCDCHFSVFDPLIGSEAVSGPAERPLPRIRLEHSQGILYASGVEITEDTG